MKLPARIDVKIDRTDTCWLWQGYRDAKGYGRVGWKGRSALAHRVVYELLVGPITKPQLDHLCRKPACCNPVHLEPVTAAVNTVRGDLPNRRKTACPKGHGYDYQFNGERGCKECRRESARNWARRTREKGRAM